MCGIVGYIGQREAKELLLDGLKKLEYRGYDSAGIAVLQCGALHVKRAVGRLENLCTATGNGELNGTAGIGHTRWATHGAPSVENSHPHCNEAGTIAVVHNGIIENHEELKTFLMEKGYRFRSETDTEVIPHLIDFYYQGELLEAVQKAAQQLKGSFAVCVMHVQHPEQIVAARKDSPLIVGLGQDENFVASDIPAVLKETRDVYLLEDGEFAVVTANDVTLYDMEKKPIQRSIYHVTFDENAAEKDGYDHFMLKEIFEQPQAIRETLRGCVAPGQPVVFDGVDYQDIAHIREIFIVACGTAYHAGLVGKNVIERLTNIPVDVDIASEFRYRHPIIDKDTLLVVISQSGETADTLAALRLAQRRGCRVLAVTNVVGSTIAREADHVFYTHAGPEIAVASTKAYTTQLIALYGLALFLAEHKGTLSEEECEMVKQEMLQLPELTAQVLESAESLHTLADKFLQENDIFYLGRGLDYAVAMEGSLKLKEISYIHSESYAGGELKHGPIALIEEGTVVIAVSTNERLRGKMESNVKEVVTRGAYVLGILTEGFPASVFDDVFYLPEVNPLFAPVLAILPLQLLSYYIAVGKECDVDKPRNLAKSVTVE
ncbi:MAG: glutamine--fructose-6-phosphate transaminase (isomerizing) [Clostridia bacterium]|nr:glutamine--fructose-6-phosphate transaminase (isomerizing) [Clostridia bacterium]